jgi:hypothetical protein
MDSSFTAITYFSKEGRVDPPSLHFWAVIKDLIQQTLESALARVIRMQLRDIHRLSLKLLLQDCVRNQFLLVFNNLGKNGLTYANDAKIRRNVCGPKDSGSRWRTRTSVRLGKTGVR